MNGAKRLMLTIEAVGVGSLLGTMSIVFAVYITQEPPAKRSHVPPVYLLLTIDPAHSSLGGHLFRLPIDAQESLFVSLRSKNGGELRYGVGPWAARIEQWRSADLFVDAKHAKIVLPSRSAEEAKGEPTMDEVISPVQLTHNAFSFQSSPPSIPSWKSGRVLRIRTQTTDDPAKETIVKVETAAFDENGMSEAIYIRGDASSDSLFIFTPGSSTTAPEINKWIVILFEPREKDGKNLLAVVGVIAGKFSTRDNSILLRSGQAACLSVDRQGRHISLMQHAALARQGGRYLVRWQPIEQAYEPLRVQIHQLTASEDIVERGIESLERMHPLTPYLMWAVQNTLFLLD